MVGPHVFSARAWSRQRAVRPVVHTLARDHEKVVSSRGVPCRRVIRTTCARTQCCKPLADRVLAFMSWFTQVIAIQAIDEGKTRSYGSSIADEVTLSITIHVGLFSQLSSSAKHNASPLKVCHTLARAVQP